MKEVNYYCITLIEWVKKYVPNPELFKETKP